MTSLRSMSLAQLLLVVACAGESAPAEAQAPAVTGRWTYTEDGTTAELDLSDAGAGRVAGTFTVAGGGAPVEGEVRGGTLVITSVGGVPASAENGTMVGMLEGAVLTVTVVQPGTPPVVMAMSRVAASDPPAPAGAAAAVEPPAPGDRASAADFTGRWESVSDDGTNREVVELAASGDAVTGTLVVIETGYYSGRETVTSEIALRGRLERGALAIQAWDVAQGSDAEPVAGRAVRRDRFLVLRLGTGESSFARPGVALVESAEQSPEAAALAQLIAGRIYSAGAEASGRGGYVGGRVRIAFCADGSMAYDASDLASVPGGVDGGVDMGSTRTRRGTWSIVLRAGAPMVRAQWEGTGSSYSLTEYFQIRAAPSGESAVIDGRELPATGSC